MASQVIPFGRRAMAWEGGLCFVAYSLFEKPTGGANIAWSVTLLSTKTSFILRHMYSCSVPSV